MRTFRDAAGATGAKRSTTIMQAETPYAANLELAALTDDELRTRLADSRPWP
jgi:hypothetical protein